MSTFLITSMGRKEGKVNNEPACFDTWEWMDRSITLGFFHFLMLGARCVAFRLDRAGWINLTRLPA